MKSVKNGIYFEAEIPEQLSGYNVEKLLREHWPTPKKMLHQFRMEKAVRINGEPVSWNLPLKAGDLFSIPIFHPEEPDVRPADIPVDILYEDDFLLIANKPAGMDTHPNTEEQTNSLANAIAGYFHTHDIHCRVRHVHRLDRDTTGAVLFAKTAWSHAILDHMLTERKIKRTYWALVQGILNQTSGTIDKPIGRDRHHATRRRVSPSGQKAKTRFHLLEQYSSENLSLIECTLDTGRTHQIRVHLSSIGHPLAGDLLYGGKPVFQRQALHARKLSFIHPFLEEKLEYTAPFLDQPPIFPPYVKNLS